MVRAETRLEVAITRENLQLALNITGKQGQAVFGTMDGRVLDRVMPAGVNTPVYFYEPG